jgi:hypothetical protein
VGINQATPTTDLDVAGAAKISGNLDMSSSGRIVNLVNPTNAQDAATRNYVETELGSSGTLTNRPTVQRGDTTNEFNYLTFINNADIASDGSNKRALMRCDSNLYYNPSSNTLYAGTFSGTATYASSAGSATSATSATSSSYAISGIYDSTNGWVLYNNNGRIGIGNTNPQYTLHLNGTGVSTNTFGGYIDYQAASVGGALSRQVVAAFEGGWVVSGVGFIIFSDQRIKSDITNVDIHSNLEIFRKIRPVNHGYIDKLEYGSVRKYGFIAQEVEQLLPDAVIKGTQIIPSIYKRATVVNNVLHFNNPIQDIQQFNIGTKLKCYDEKNEIVWVVIKAIIDTQNIEIEEEITNDMLFVYGHSVDDFLQLDKETIWTVATAALQEVDRQQQADKARIAELESTVATQQSLIHDILERLKVLERV